MRCSISRKQPDAQIAGGVRSAGPVGHDLVGRVRRGRRPCPRRPPGPPSSRAARSAKISLCQRPKMLMESALAPISASRWITALRFSTHKPEIGLEIVRNLVQEHGLPGAGRGRTGCGSAGTDWARQAAERA